MKTTVLLLIAVFSFSSCSQRFSDSPEGLAISAHFNSKQDKVFLPAKSDELQFSPGLEKKGLASKLSLQVHFKPMTKESVK